MSSLIRVLIVDDEEKVCQLIINLINWDEIGMEVIAYSLNGIDALNIIEEKHPDLIITDIRMPGYNGIELIKRAKEINKDVDFIIISGYKHFDYAHNAIKYGVEDYLLKPINKIELTDALLKMADKYKQKKEQFNEFERNLRNMKTAKEKIRAGFMANILSCENDKCDDLSMDFLNKEYYFNFKRGYFQAIVVNPDVNYCDDSENLRKLLMDKTTWIVEKIFKPICYEMQCYVFQTCLYCILNYDDEVKNNIRKYLRSIIDEINTMNDLFPNLRVNIASSNIADGIDKLGTLLINIKYNILQKIIVGPGKIIEFSSLNNLSLNVKMFIDNERRRQLLNFIEILNKDSILTWIDSLYDKVSQNKDVTGSLLFDIVEDIIEIFIFSFKNDNFAFDNSISFFPDHHKKINKCMSIEELFSLIKQEASKYIDDINTMKKQSNIKPIRKAKEYMKDNFKHPITLEEISKMVGFNPTYFSSLFKKETGMNFLEYLIDIRIEKAKELLKETDKSVSSIAFEVGYSDLKHFSKLFKKLTGLKPSEYRKFYL